MRGPYILKTQLSKKISRFFRLNTIGALGRGIYAKEKSVELEKERERLKREQEIGGPRYIGVIQDPQGNSALLVEHSTDFSIEELEEAFLKSRHEKILAAYDKLTNDAWIQYGWVLPESTKDHWALGISRYVGRAKSETVELIHLTPIHTNPVAPSENYGEKNAVLEALKRRVELADQKDAAWPTHYLAIARAGLENAKNKPEYLAELKEKSRSSWPRAET